MRIKRFILFGWILLLTFTLSAQTSKEKMTFQRYGNDRIVKLKSRVIYKQKSLYN